MLKSINSIIAGIILGVIAILLHNTLIPVGLILALLAEGVGLWYLGNHYGSRFYKFLAAISWLAIVLRGGTPGAGNEVLVLGDSLGLIFLLAGFVIATFVTLKKI